METHGEIKLYKRRWLFMAVFVLYQINSSMQWIQFAIISDIIMKYYDVPLYYVEWTTDIYVLAYLLLLFPSLYILNKIGIRYTMIIICIGSCIASWTKVFATARDKFYVILIAQSSLAVCSVLNFGIAARFTAIWFGVNEISLAGSISLIGDQLGLALGFLVPPQIIGSDPDNISAIEMNLKRMHISMAVLITTILIFIILVFQDEPKTPPSAAQVLQKNEEIKTTYETVKEILCTPAFLLMSLSYGLCNGTFVTISKLLNEVILTNFPNRNKDVGNIGFILMISGIVGSSIDGYILDVTRKFKENLIILTSGACVSTMIFTFSLYTQNMIGLYISCALFGLFMESIYVTGVQTCIEITYPVPENVSSSTMFLLAEVLAIIITLSYSRILKYYGNITSNIVIVILLLISAFVACLISPNFKRQKAEQTMNLKK